MTAEVIQLFPTGELADDTVRRTIKALMHGRGITAENMAPSVNMTVATLYRRLGGSGSAQAFKAGEVASIANYFDVSVADLFGGLGGTFVPPDGGGNIAPSTASSSLSSGPPTSSYPALSAVA